jgi:hypothetical protein
MWRFHSLLALALTYSVTAQSGKPVPAFDIDLDKAPDQRFNEVVGHFNSSIQAFYHKFLNNGALKVLLFGLAKKRGPENDELMGEVHGIARETNLPVYGLHAIQMLYEIQTVMVPIWNITLPWSGPGCAGIIGLNKEDGMVYHARNQDFSPAPYMQSLTYTATFKKSGQELFKAQMIAGYALPLTGLKKGSNGFSMETNTRYLDHHGGNKEWIHNLLTEKRPLNSWTVRKILEEQPDFESAVKAAKEQPLIATQYLIMSGVKKGTIIARNPDNVARQLILGQPNYHCRDDYIIVTNFDYWYHDIREYFDPTSQLGLGHSRRTAAQKILNSSTALTQDVMWKTISDMGVEATDTIFQAVINVETGMWNVTLPPCKDCIKPETVIV